MRITRETKVGDELARKFWEIYEVAFAPLHTASPCRQFLLRDEFIAEMSDERVLKFVLWDNDGNAVAMALVATYLEAVPWISPEYYAARFPREFADRRIYYFGALLVEPGSRGLKYSEILLAELENFVFTTRGIACFDCMDSNDTFLPALIRDTGEKQGAFEVQKLDRQHYYAYLAEGFKPGFAPGILPDGITVVRG